AARTERIHIGTNVLGLPYRHPTVTAKMAETIHRLSDGRFVLGLGGGASDAEFRAWGLGVRTRSEKVDALAEAMEIIRGMWSRPHFSFDGQHYRTEEAQLEPKPAERIPIWLGVYGKRSLALAGRVADGWIPSLPFAPPPKVAAMRDRIRRAAEDAGRDPAALTYAYNVPVLVQDGAADPQGRTVAGSVRDVAERVAAFVAMGFRCLILSPRGDRTGGRERLASEVLPLVREIAEESA
ncbi:MAG TPA: LLM class flavin-dependent oxidoreductase, partial [Actinomycetota bacterium]